MSTAGYLDVRELIDHNRLTGKQKLSTLVALLCIVVDGLEVIVVGFIAPALKADWGLSTAQLAPAVTSGLVGLALGSFVAGPLGDRFGRKPVILTAVAAFAVITLVTPLAGGVVSFSVLRLLTGFGLGASMPNVAALVAELTPTRHRRALVGLSYAGFPTGAAIGAAVLPFIVAGAGWKVAMLLCGLAAVAIGIAVLFLLAESPRFLASSGRNRATLVRFCNDLEPGSADDTTVFTLGTPTRGRNYPISALFRRGLAPGTIFLWVGFLAVMFTVYLNNTWLPFLFADTGFETGQISLLTTLLQVGGIVGCSMIGLLQERFGPQATLVVTGAVGALMALSIALVPASTTVLAILIFVLGMATNSISTGYTVVSSTFYPTDIRSTGTSWTAGVSRIGSVAGAAVGTALVSLGFSISQVFLLLLVPIAIGALAMAAKGVVYRRRPTAGDDAPHHPPVTAESRPISPAEQS
ncbi:MFS transporter [Pseudonocardia lutea]|uniref:MFS transporter n=1 Tax=Pseudonocardia lutea TaxID=2172015 RepID=A0ABW1I597_9PSEU